MNKILSVKKAARYHAEYGLPLSDIEKQEMTAVLLNRDMRLERSEVITQILQEDSYKLFDAISDFLYTESDDSKEDVLNAIKELFMRFYNDEIDAIIVEEKEVLKEERKYINPKDEYDPND